MTNREALSVINRLRISLKANEVKEKTAEEWRAEIDAAYACAEEALKRSIKLDNAKKRFERSLDDYNHRK